MLKHLRQTIGMLKMDSAAFGRLCVETDIGALMPESTALSAAFGRLCVETFSELCLHRVGTFSRLRAAVC